MATTKKSTKAKTKTTKKPAVKPAKAVKAVKKSVSTKAVKNVSVKKASVNSGVRSRGNVLQQLHLISGIITLGLAVAAGMLMSTQAYQLFTGLLTKDELASQTTTVFAPAIHSVFDLELRWAVVGIMGIAAFMSLLLASRLRRQYAASIKNRVHMWRWIDTAIVGALMVEVTALLSGVQDIATLKVIGGMVAVSCLLGWVAEKQHAEAERPATAPYALSLVAGLLPWLLIGTYAVSTYVYGMVRSPWYVYALYAVGLLSFMAYAWNTRNQLRGASAGRDYAKVERNYLVINLLTRSAFALVLITGLMK